ncbi:peptidylprolyl isomerase [Candidatus Parvarchaeota archaeon]|nr:peptidylprolyl isomerase [Candidatus Parvarchaeota archaeon]
MVIAQERNGSGKNPSKGSFVRISYSGYAASSNAIFDTTFEEDARASGVFDPNGKYGPALAVFGNGHLMAGVERQLATMKEGEMREFELEPTDAFGVKSQQLVRIVPLSTFKKNNVMPQPGQTLEIDGRLALVKSVTSGRVLVDFNHPLAGERIRYKLRLDKVLSAPIEKIAALMELNNIRCEAAVDEKNEKKLTLEFSQPENMQEYEMKKRLLIDGIKKFVPEIEEIGVKESFSTKSADSKQAETEKKN